MCPKKNIRNKYIEIRNSFSNESINNISKIISYKLFDLTEYKKCKNIFIYLSTEKELNTKYIIENAHSNNKNIYCPVITKKKREMIFKKYNEQNLIKNKFNILEPLYEEEKISDKETLIIVPALVYNKNKYRIGYGGGYYDNFLKNNTFLASIGICFDDFMVDFKEDYYDENVNIVITEKNIY